MGVKGTKMSPEAKNAKDVDRILTKQIKADNLRQDRIVKILLLGTGESGKSTIFKQVKELYGDKYGTKDVKTWQPMVYENINKQIVAMVKASTDLNIPFADPEVAKTWTSVAEYPVTTPITPDLASKMKDFWHDKGVQKIWERRAEFQVLDCIEYYMQNIDRIGAGPNKYVPKFDDFVHARVRTTGIITERFTIRRSPFEMYDVGGQRSERKKWLNIFDNVTTVIFVAAINEYDQTLYEEQGVDRIQEAVRVWKDIVNRDEFKNVGFVLFLNKFDLFSTKVTQFPFRTEIRNADYGGADPMEQTDQESIDSATLECAEYMKQKFMAALDHRRGIGAVNAYFTNATDTRNMKLVFDTCEEQILRLNLASGGFGPMSL